MIKNCIVCNSSFECSRSNALYCGRTCQDRALKERRRKKILVSEIGKPCPICEKTFFPKNASSNQRQVCYDCLPDGEILTRGKILNFIRQKQGGKCVVCGYDKYLGALHFHHLNPNEKDFTISNDRIKLVEAVEESKKCILLCANCHAEVHAGLIELEGEDK